MAELQTQGPHIIGLTGSFGSGCTYVANTILVKKGYRKVSLSDLLKEEFRKNTGKNPADVARRELQDFGDKMRQEQGDGVLAKMAIQKIEEAGKQEPEAIWVVDSIRNPEEIRVFRPNPNFFLFGINADKEIRWKRVEKRYNGNQKDFDDDDKNDTGQDNPKHGQRVGDCFSEADILLTNDENFLALGNERFQDLEGRILQYADLAAKPLQRRQPIRTDESLMAMADAASQRSSCLKRKVGAVIADELGNVVSSGFNEVPPNEKPCQAEYTKCRRDNLTDDFLNFAESEGFVQAERRYELRKAFRERFKILDYCRALHAEENAIMNMVRNGRSPSLASCTLYTTTYPCRMCANKIVGIGIKHVVYREPYPDEEAKVILEDGGVNREFFEGITFQAYFRIYGEQK